MLMMAVTVALVIAMNENAMDFAQRCYVHLHPLVVRIVIAKFGQMDKHLWKTVTIAHVFATEENVMLNVQRGYVHLNPLVVRIAMAML